MHFKDFFSKCEQICSCSDTSITCPIIATFILNCYVEPAISFVVENKKTNKQKKIKRTQQKCEFTPLGFKFYLIF